MRRAISARPLALACFAPSTDPDGAGASEPMDPSHGFFPRLHLAAFYLWGYGLELLHASSSNAFRTLIY
jgi:hypothetical protein